MDLFDSKYQYPTQYYRSATCSPTLWCTLCRALYQLYKFTKPHTHSGISNCNDLNPAFHRIDHTRIDGETPLTIENYLYQYLKGYRYIKQFFISFLTNNCNSLIWRTIPRIMIIITLCCSFLYFHDFCFI